MKRYALGVDLGGSKISYALLTEEGEVCERHVEATGAEEGSEAVIERMAARIRDYTRRHSEEITGIGIGAAGATDSRRGIVLIASNLQWRDVPLRRKLLDRLGDVWEDRILVDKDTNAAVLGEMYFGAGRGCEHLLYVTVGTGVGGGMVLDGCLYHGASQAACDIGHLILQPDGPQCGCGKCGCLEALASGPAIARTAAQASRNAPESVLHSMAPERITAISVVDAAREGDRLALDVLEQAGRWLGIALAYYVNINNPERIIIGGGVGSAGDILLHPIRRVIAEQALPPNAQAVRVFTAGLQADSGVIGAACLIWHHQKKGQERHE